MKSFPIRASVRKVFLDNIILTVQAENEQDAVAMAERVLEQYPDPITGGSVPFFYVENRETEDTVVANVEIRKDVIVA